MGYLGYHGVLGHLSALLQPPSINPHATLIMLFMNVVDETLTQEDERSDTMASFQTRMKYLGLPRKPPSSMYDPGMILLNFAGSLIRDFDKYFNR